MKPSAYFHELVEPAIAEFEANPTSIRHAYAACMFAWHFADAVLVRTGHGPHASRKAKGDALEAIRSCIAALANPPTAFGTIAGIANMVKHLEVTDPRLPVKPKPEDTHVGPEAAWSDDGTYWLDHDGSEVSWSDAENVVRTKDDQGNFVDVRWCVRKVRDAIEAYLVSRPELG
jgi:hypothetical protein